MSTIECREHAATDAAAQTLVTFPSPPVVATKWLRGLSNELGSAVVNVVRSRDVVWHRLNPSLRQDTAVVCTKGPPLSLLHTYRPVECTCAIVNAHRSAALFYKYELCSSFRPTCRRVYTAARVRRRYGRSDLHTSFLKNLLRLHVLVFACFYAAFESAANQSSVPTLCTSRTIRFGRHSGTEPHKTGGMGSFVGGSPYCYISVGAGRGRHSHLLKNTAEGCTEAEKWAPARRRRARHPYRHGGPITRGICTRDDFSGMSKSQENLVFVHSPLMHHPNHPTCRAWGSTPKQASNGATETLRFCRYTLVSALPFVSRSGDVAQLNMRSFFRHRCWATFEKALAYNTPPVRKQMYAHRKNASLIQPAASVLGCQLVRGHLDRSTFHNGRMDLSFLFSISHVISASQHRDPSPPNYSSTTSGRVSAFFPHTRSLSYSSSLKGSTTSGAIPDKEKQVLGSSDFLRGVDTSWNVCVDSDWKTYTREQLLSNIEKSEAADENTKKELINEALYDIQRFPDGTLESIPSSGRLHTEQMRARDVYLERAAADKAAAGDDDEAEASSSSSSKGKIQRKTRSRRLTWRDYLSWLPPSQPQHYPVQRSSTHRETSHGSHKTSEKAGDKPQLTAIRRDSSENKDAYSSWEGFPPPASTKIDDLPLDSLIWNNETLLYRQAFKEAPMIIDDETFRRLKSRWKDAEELKRVQHEEKGLYGIPEDVPDDSWIPISPDLSEGRLVQEYGLVPNITVTEAGYDYIETYHDPARNYTWAYKQWNPLKQEGEPPRDLEGEASSIYELDTEKSRRYWHEEANPPPLKPDDGIFRQATVADEMIKGTKRTPLGMDQWHYTPTHPLGQAAELQSFWLTAVKRTLPEAMAQRAAEASAAVAAGHAAPPPPSPTTSSDTASDIRSRGDNLHADAGACSIPHGGEARSQLSICGKQKVAHQVHATNSSPITGHRIGGDGGADKVSLYKAAVEEVSPGTNDVMRKLEKAGEKTTDPVTLSSPGAVTPYRGVKRRLAAARRSAYQPLAFNAGEDAGADTTHFSDDMKYRQLGKSELFVSEVGLGTMTVGSPQLDEKTTKELLSYAVDAWGVNFIDTAELYPLPATPYTYGKAEEIIGRWLGSTGRRSGCKREELVIATKVAGPSPKLEWLRSTRSRSTTYVNDVPKKYHPGRYQQQPDVGEGTRGTSRSSCGDASPPYAGTSLSKTQIIQAAEGSIRRLQTDYIDLFQLHWPERYVPMQNSGDSAEVLYDPQAARLEEESRDVIAMEEQLEAIKELLRQGKIRTWGLSNETPYGVCRFTRLAIKDGLPPPASVQLQYNLLCRNDVEKGFVELARPQNAGTGLLAYGALAGGVLTGKYLEWLEKPTTGRLLRFPSYMRRYRGSLAAKAVTSYYNLALRLGHPNLTVMALRWVFTRPFVCSTLLGFTDMYQLRENLYCTQPVCGIISDWTEREINFLHWKWRDTLRIIQ